jgi:hypothetical protein
MVADEKKSNPKENRHGLLFIENVHFELADSYLAGF